MDEHWYDWKWQYKNSMIDAADYVKEDGNYFNMRVTPYYCNLIDLDNLECPIRKQAIPSNKEREIQFDSEQFGIDMNDSLSEEHDSPVPNLVHRYPDRVLLTVTNNCFMYCRFCTRKRITSTCSAVNDLEKAYDYIRKHHEVRDVLISGGDPFTLEDDALETILSTLKQIKHIEIIRIGTRAPVVLPMRVTDKLVTMLSKYKPLFINTHFNHPKEITHDSKEACAKIIDAGIPMGNQSVLLRGVNDNVETYKELCLKLIQNRVKPYYLYQCDLGEGNEHFRTKVDVGIMMMNRLRQSITGMAVPTYVIDAPNGGGKIPITPNYIIDRNDERIILRNGFNQKVYLYPETMTYKIENETDES